MRNKKDIEIDFTGDGVDIQGHTIRVTAKVVGAFEYGAHFRPTGPEETLDIYGWALDPDEIQWKDITLDDMAFYPQRVKDISEGDLLHELSFKSIKELKEQAIDDLHNEFQKQL